MCDTVYSVYYCHRFSVPLATTGFMTFYYNDRALTFSGVLLRRPCADIPWRLTTTFVRGRFVEFYISDHSLTFSGVLLWSPCANASRRLILTSSHGRFWRFTITSVCSGFEAFYYNVRKLAFHHDVRAWTFHGVLLCHRCENGQLISSLRTSSKAL